MCLRLHLTVCGRHRDSDKAIPSLFLCPHWKALLSGFAMGAGGSKGDKEHL